MTTLLIILLIAGNVLFAITFVKYAILREDVANFCAKLKRNYDTYLKDGEPDAAMEAAEYARQEFNGELPDADDRPTLKDVHESIQRNYNSEYE